VRWCGEPFDSETPGADEECDESEHGHDRAERCEHGATDGTLSCPGCGMLVSEFLSSAFDWLAARDGEVIECGDYHANNK
jgi:hypothetical protein